MVFSACPCSVTGFLLEFALSTLYILEERRLNAKEAAQRPKPLGLHNGPVQSTTHTHTTAMVLSATPEMLGKPATECEV